MSTDPTQRWTRRRRVSASDIGAWLVFALLTAAILLALCVLATIVWPTP